MIPDVDEPLDDGERSQVVVLHLGGSVHAGPLHLSCQLKGLFPRSPKGGLEFSERSGIRQAITPVAVQLELCLAHRDPNPVRSPAFYTDEVVNRFAVGIRVLGAVDAGHYLITRRLEIGDDLLDRHSLGAAPGVGPQEEVDHLLHHVHESVPISIRAQKRFSFTGGACQTALLRRAYSYYNSLISEHGIVPELTERAAPAFTL